MVHSGSGEVEVAYVKIEQPSERNLFAVIEPSTNKLTSLKLY